MNTSLKKMFTFFVFFILIACAIGCHYQHTQSSIDHIIPFGNNKSIGPFSPAVMAQGKFVFISGQIPRHPTTGEMAPENIEAQTRQVLDNVKRVVQNAGSSMDRVVKVTIFLDDMDNYAAVNKIYAEYFPAPAPARACVQVARLPLDVKIEIECIALVQ